MKRIATIFTLSLFTFALAFGQAPSSDFVGAKLGVTVGGDIEMPHNLGHAYLLNTAEDTGLDVSALPFEDGDLTRMDCDNGTARFTFSITPGTSTNTELQFSLLSIDGRIDMVHYKLPEPDHYLEVSAENQEVALEGVFLKTDRVNKTFSFSGGIGTNIGYSHNGEVRVKGYLRDTQFTDDPEVAQEIDYTYKQKDSFNQRIFLQAGMGIRFLKVMEFGLNFRKGLGYRASIDGPFKTTTLKRSIGLSLKYVY